MPKKPGPKKGEGGRPRKEIDWNDVDNLCRFHAPANEIADYISVTMFAISYDTLDRRAQEEHGMTFAEYVRQKSISFGKCRLRQLQWEAAEKGNVTMLIWLGKQMLDQRDQQALQVAGPDGKAPIFEVIIPTMGSGNGRDRTPLD